MFERKEKILLIHSLFSTQNNPFLSTTEGPFNGREDSVSMLVKKGGGEFLTQKHTKHSQKSVINYSTKKIVKMEGE